MQYLFHPKCPENLKISDFITFRGTFAEALGEFLPIFEEVVFVHHPEDAARYLHSADAQQDSAGFFRFCDDSSGFIRCHKQQILFGVPAEVKTLAVVSGLDTYFIKHVAGDWLQEFQARAIERFARIKAANVDRETGLLNGFRFLDDLGHISSATSATTLLVELYPRAGSASESELHAAKSVHALQGCVPASAPLYSLRHHVYGVILHETSKKVAHAVARKLLIRLRTEGFAKVRIGMRCEISGTKGDDHHLSGRKIYTQIGEALDTARKRGPYALCDYEHILYPERHPLRRPSKRTIATLRREYRQLERFCVILFQLSEPGRRAATVHRLLGDVETIADGEDIYILLAGVNADYAREWAAEKIARFEGIDIRGGIAAYPYAHFGKSQTVYNSRKALRHAEFYGPGGLAVFNPLSLNVSGDIYYEEGDLTSAVREYKDGLECNPEEINLLNSLGVCYVDMGRHSLARKCFAKALRRDGNNFMALVNAGLEAVRLGKHSEAIGFLHKARTLEPSSPEVRGNIAFQLGRLYCLTGKHELAISLLQTLEPRGEQSFFYRKSFTYLGKSYSGLERYDLAAKWLQKALHVDEFDAEAMGMLGHVYLLRGEGRDIALSLCTKSVELAPGNGRLRLYLAEALISCGRFQEARQVLGRCLRSKETQQEARLLRCASYIGEGRPGLARRRLEELQKHASLDETGRDRLKKLYEELDGADGQKREKKGD